MADSELDSLLETTPDEVELLQKKINRLDQVRMKVEVRLRKLRAALDALTSDDDAVTLTVKHTERETVTSHTPSEGVSKKTSSAMMIRDLLQNTREWLTRREIHDRLSATGTPVSMPMAHVALKRLIEVGEVESSDAPKGSASQLVYAIKGTPKTESEDTSSALTLFPDGES